MEGQCMAGRWPDRDRLIKAQGVSVIVGRFFLFLSFPTPTRANQMPPLSLRSRLDRASVAYGSRYRICSHVAPDPNFQGKKQYLDK
jgi:hypothetical protein